MWLQKYYNLYMWFDLPNWKQDYHLNIIQNCKLDCWQWHHRAQTDKLSWADYSLKYCLFFLTSLLKAHPSHLVSLQLVSWTQGQKFLFIHVTFHLVRFSPVPQAVKIFLDAMSVINVFTILQDLCHLQIWWACLKCWAGAQ